MGWFFFKAGAFTFGSGLAIVPFLHQGLVADHRWLTEQQFVDAVAMGLISPGARHDDGHLRGPPGLWTRRSDRGDGGRLLAALLFVVIPGPLIRRHENHPRLRGFIKAATAAAAGAVAGAAIVIAPDVINDGWSVVIAVAALAVLLLNRSSRSPSRRSSRSRRSSGSSRTDSSSGL